MAGDAIAGLSTGGMKSKVEAALSATKVGIPLIVTNGMEEHALRDLCAGKSKSTLFTAKDEDKKNARKTWISSHLDPKGSVHVDDGAREALIRGNSLLPIGVTRIEGEFKRGDIIKIYDQQGVEIGTGISAYSAREATEVMGQKSEDIEAILGYSGRKSLMHRNDMALSI